MISRFLLSRCATALAVAMALLPPPANAAGFPPPAAIQGTSHIRSVAVFGRDERVLLPRLKKSLEDKIGLLYESRSKTVCTAFCVDQTTVATAAHCLYRTKGERPLPLARVTFRIAGKSSATQSRIEGADRGRAALYVMAGSANVSIKPPIEASKDWALLRLAKPICKSGGLTLSRRQPADLVANNAIDRIYQVGFHGDFGNWRLTLSPPCRISRSTERADSKAIAQDFADPAYLLLHTCDTGGASSGSPLLVDGAGGPEVVGVNVGTYLQSRVLTEAGRVVHRFRAAKIANTAVSSLAFAGKSDIFRRASIVGDRPAVLRIQSALKSAGLYDGALDGTYGVRLREAIANFEQSERRVPTGLATDELLRRLTLLSISRLASPKPDTNALREESGGVEETASGRHAAPIRR